MTHDGLTRREFIRLHALQASNPNLSTDLRIAQAEKMADFLFGPEGRSSSNINAASDQCKDASESV